MSQNVRNNYQVEAIACQTVLIQILMLIEPSIKIDWAIQTGVRVVIAMTQC